MPLPVEGLVVDPRVKPEDDECEVSGVPQAALGKCASMAFGDTQPLS